MIRRWMTVSPPDRLIGACETALRRLEATRGDPPHVFAETGEVLFWLYAIGDTGKPQDHLLSPGFQWARHQYAHGNLITEPVEYHYGATLGHFVLGKSRLGEPPIHRWAARPGIGRYEKAHPRPELEESDYDAHLAGQPVIATLWNELSELVAIVNPRDLARDE
jgi:hypothetical protein